MRCRTFCRCTHCSIFFFRFIYVASDLIGNLQQAQNESSRVAFFATASESQGSLSKNQIIQFDHVWTNVGHFYDSLTGIFTAPVNGTYSFQTTILSDQKSFWGYLAVNGHLKCSLYAGTDNRVSVSQSLIVTLQEGDQVTVRNNNDEGMIYGSFYTTFGGYSLFS